MTTIGDIYNKLKEIAELERVRDAVIGSNRILMSMFLNNDDMNYIREHNNIPIKEDSSEQDRKIHDEVEGINRRIDEIMKIEID